MDKKHPNVVDATDPMFWRDSSEAGEDADTHQPEPKENDAEKQDPENMSIREMFANLPDVPRRSSTTHRLRSHCYRLYRHPFGIPYTSSHHRILWCCMDGMERHL